jgi:hypothetical protein
MNDAELGWYVRSRGRVLGPFQLPQLENLKRQGRLAKFDELSRDRRTWVAASSLPELYPAEVTPAAAGPGTIQPADSGPAVVAGPSAQLDDGPAWFHMSEKGQVGPIKFSEIYHLAQIGVVRAETLVWNSQMTDWTTAREVPALGLAGAAPPKATAGTPGVGSSVRATNPMALNGFILGIVGLVAAVVSFFCSVLRSVAGQNRDALAGMWLGFGIVWLMCSLLAAIMGAIGLVRANRAGGSRPGFGLGLTGMILGLVGLAPVLFMILFMALAMLAATGAPR